MTAALLASVGLPLPVLLPCLLLLPPRQRRQGPSRQESIQPHCLWHLNRCMQLLALCLLLLAIPGDLRAAQGRPQA
jgi:hypothetical protein